jgi:hypothetical protein
VIDGVRLAAVLVMMLGLTQAASGAEEPIAAPDAIATRVQVMLRGRYKGDDGLDRVARVLDIEKRIGAYRAARTKAEFVHRINADLWVATRDRRVCVKERSAADSRQFDPGQFDLSMGLQLAMPGAAR